MSFEQAADSAAAGTVAPTGASAAPSDAGASVLADGRIVMNGRIFTPEDAAKKMGHGDSHIQKLEAEAAERDRQLAEALDRIKAMEEKSTHTDNTQELADAAAAAAVAAAAPEPSPPTQEISKEEILAAVRDDLKAEQLEATRASNLQTIIAEAKEAFGAEFGEKVDSMAAEHGMTPADAVEMANDRPAVFRALFLKGVQKKADPDVTGSGAGGSVGLAPPAPAPRKKFTQIRGAKERKAFIDARYAEIAARNSNP